MEKILLLEWLLRVRNLLVFGDDDRKVVSKYFAGRGYGEIKQWILYNEPNKDNYVRG